MEITSITIVGLLWAISSCQATAGNNIEVVCPNSDDGWSVLLPHPYDCSKFFICDSVHVGHEMDCPNGLQFDPEAEVCDWADVVNCVNPTHPTHPHPTHTTPLTSTTSTEPPTTTTSDGIHVVCPPSGDGLAVFVPHPFDCSKYFMCHGLNGIAMTCNDNLQFDPELNVCNYESEVHCVNTPCPTRPTRPTDPTHPTQPTRPTDPTTTESYPETTTVEDDATTTEATTPEATTTDYKTTTENNEETTTTESEDDTTTTQAEDDNTTTDVDYEVQDYIL
jgi:hypothetical protein